MGRWGWVYSGASWDRPAADALTEAEQKQKRAGVTDGLRLPASPAYLQRGEARDSGAERLQRADGQVGQQTDRRTNASEGSRPACRQMYRQICMCSGELTDTRCPEDRRARETVSDTSSM